MACIMLLLDSNDAQAQRANTWPAEVLLLKRILVFVVAAGAVSEGGNAYQAFV